ncbi:mucin-3A-like [Ceratina calcarata]|uniref:Mucin-3A-like n=2 Tax=Ceratina calcarata TaxID=156304 RepID=A0AAJ7WDI9_9HYME|nr:mucin-3A-like [Ceratina calcarata]
MKILVVLSSFVISIVVSQPVKESGIDDTDIIEYGAHRYARDLKSDPPLCRVNQYFDKEKNKCMNVIGGGKVLHINSSTSCGVNALKPHCASPKYYYICTGNKMILAQCPDGRHFEDRLQKCVLVPRDRYIPIADPSNSNELPVCESPGSFPVPNDCALFYTCRKKFFGMNRNFYRCPKKMMYDVNNGMCSPSSTCDDSTLPLSCPPSIQILNEGRHLVRRSKPIGEEKRTTIICKIVYLNEEEGTTRSVENVDTTTDSLIIKLDNDTASTAERDHSTTPAGENTEESINEFEVTTSEDSFTDAIVPFEVTTNPSLILTSLKAASTEEYYENTPAFTSTNSVTNVPTNFDSILSESEVLVERNIFREEYITTQNIAEGGSTPIIFTDLNTTIQTTTEVNEYTTKELVSESQSTIVPNVTSGIFEELENNDENTEEPFKDSTISNTEFTNENPIITSMLPYSSLNKNEQTTTDQTESTNIQEYLIPFNDLTTESNNEETSSKITDDAIGTSYTTEYLTTSKYDSGCSSTDAANDFDTIITTTEGIGFSESTSTEVTLSTIDDSFDSVTLRDVTIISNASEIIENNAFFDLESIPQEATSKNPVTNLEELSSSSVNLVTENVVTELNSQSTDNDETFEAEKNVTKAKTTSSPQQMRTVSKNIMLPIASAVLNVTDKLERYIRAILINYFSRYV